MKHKTTKVLGGALLLAALTLSTAAFGEWQASGKANPYANRTPAPPAQTTPQDGVQTATIEVTGKGFEPASLKLQVGTPAKVTFTRKTDETCAKEVVIKDYNLKRALPLDEAVTLEFTPRKGEFSFACGMNMLKGKLIVE
ncbi:MAG: cupredoxin domain-containing protein [Acidobacteria bacterium]|nr:cupredoxin domain-containing protein [Acidobacteriota bacterium]MBI3422068.1 cupredoxin domain-containing protein [Acidobacteriota bacterium]